MSWWRVSGLGLPFFSFSHLHDALLGAVLVLVIRVALGRHERERLSHQQQG